MKVEHLPINSSNMSKEEWAVRCDLAAAYRLMALLGLEDSIYTHISVRVPNTDNQFLINPYGMLFRDVTASSLVKIDVNGKIMSPTPYDVNPAGFTIHSAIHMAREDAHCVVHTHTVGGVAVASMACGLQPCNQWALQFFNRVSYHDFEGIALNHAERERLVNDFGIKNKALILRNHGLLTVGHTVQEAFIYMINLERACRVQVAIQSAGQIPYPVSTEVCELTAKQYESGESNRLANNPNYCQREWNSLLERLKPSSAGNYNS